ncbi:unannotated protein [freshwater metagenome]|uniref:Unannotated protein n=1 Tax=freshwater metagenome TaxID=449393 RepID=A0A6J6ML81_9ZZZZ
MRIVSAPGSRSAEFSGNGFGIRDLVSRPEASNLALIA